MRALTAKMEERAEKNRDFLGVAYARPGMQLALTAAHIRRDADAQAERLVREANTRADSASAQSTCEADALLPPGA